MPEANRGLARRTGDADMTHTETNCYGIPQELIATSRRQARRMRTRVVFHLLRRTMKRLSPGRLRPAPALLRPAVQPI
jgi:hypothetical protein